MGGARIDGGAASGRAAVGWGLGQGGGCRGLYHCDDGAWQRCFPGSRGGTTAVDQAGLRRAGRCTWGLTARCDDPTSKHNSAAGPNQLDVEINVPMFITCP
jgi:hypothetical protein